MGKTKRELVFERELAVDELNRVKAEVAKAKVELGSVRKSHQEIVKEQEREAKRLQEWQASLARQEKELNASIDRTHLRLAVSVEELSDRALALKQEIFSHNKVIEDLQSEQKRLKDDIEASEEYRVILLGHIDSLKRQMEKVKGDSLEAAEQLKSLRLQVNSAEARLEEANKEAESLQKREKDLAVSLVRIRNYYKKAGLRFVE